MFKINPIILKPNCLSSGKEQDCFNCKIWPCFSTRSKCICRYPDHKKGCPNYGIKEGCPPSCQMFDEVFDLKKDVYAVYVKFDLQEHVNKMKKLHPKWSEKQARCVLYWQGSVYKKLKQEIAMCLKILKGYGHTLVPEAMGVNVQLTMKKIGIILDFPPKENVYKIAFLGKLINEMEENKLEYE